VEQKHDAECGEVMSGSGAARIWTRVDESEGGLSVERHNEAEFEETHRQKYPLITVELIYRASCHRTHGVSLGVGDTSWCRE
jgi:hypothetical protein